MAWVWQLVWYSMVVGLNKASRLVASSLCCGVLCSIWFFHHRLAMRGRVSSDGGWEAGREDGDDHCTPCRHLYSQSERRRDVISFDREFERNGSTREEPTRLGGLRWVFRALL